MRHRDVLAQNAVSGTANGTALFVDGMAACAFQVTGTFTATVTFEATLDGTTWVSLQVANVADGSVGTTATAPGVFQAAIAGLDKVRARVAWSSGTSVTVRINAVEAGAGMSFADVDIAGAESVNATLQAGTASVGATTDDGPSWTTVKTYTTSADMTSPADITAAPTGGEKLVITDIIIGTDTAMVFEFKIETAGTVLSAVRLAADSTVQITPRGTWKLPTADKKLQGDAGAAGNVYITVFYYSEA